MFVKSRDIESKRNARGIAVEGVIEDRMNHYSCFRGVIGRSLSVRNHIESGLSDGHGATKRNQPVPSNIPR